MPRKIIIEIALHDDADASRAEDVIDNMLDAGTIQDEINDEVIVGDVEDDASPRAVVSAHCYTTDDDDDTTHGSATVRVYGPSDACPERCDCERCRPELYVKS